MIFVIGLILWLVGGNYVYKRRRYPGVTAIEAIALLATLGGFVMMVVSVLMLLWRLMP